MGAELRSTILMLHPVSSGHRAATICAFEDNICASPAMCAHEIVQMYGECCAGGAICWSFDNGVRWDTSLVGANFVEMRAVSNLPGQFPLAAGMSALPAPPVFKIKTQTHGF